MLRWAWRHKKSIIAGSLIGAGAYGAYRIWRKKREIDELLQSVGLDQLVDLFGTNGGESSGSSSREARVREHFAATQREADRLLLEALPRLHEQIERLLDTGAFREQMRADRAMADMGRWRELLCLVVARLLTAQYALSLVALQLRINLNIVSRHYLLELAQKESHGDDGALMEQLSSLTKRRFLSTQHLLSESLAALAEDVSAVVRAHFGSWSLDASRLAQRHTAEEAMQLFQSARAELEAGLAVGDSSSGLASLGNGSGSGGRGTPGRDERPVVATFLLDALGRAHGVVAEGDQLHGLLEEVRAVIRSPAFRLTASDLLSESFGCLTTELQLHMQSVGAKPPAAAAATANGNGAATNGTAAANGTAANGIAPLSSAPAGDPALPLAKVLAQLHHLAVGTLGVTEPYSEAVLATPSLDELCWLVYSGD